MLVLDKLHVEMCIEVVLVGAFCNKTVELLLLVDAVDDGDELVAQLADFSLLLA